MYKLYRKKDNLYIETIRNDTLLVLLKYEFEIINYKPKGAKHLGESSERERANRQTKQIG